MRVHRFIHAFRALVRGVRLDRELDSEVSFHLEMETEKYMREGMNRDEARAHALRNFGPMEKHKEEARDARGVSWLEHLMQDVQYGVRALVKNPAFALLAILTLGLGIGANTAIFSVIHGVLLKPLPYANGDRLVLIRQLTPQARQQNFGVSITELYDYRKQLSSFEGIVEFHQMTFDLLRRGDPDRVDTGVVSPNFFDVLGIKPILGRAFVDGDDDEGAEAVLILGHAYWQGKFGGDPNVIGQVFEMNDRPHTVVGVLPSVPHYPNEVDVYMPTSACPFRAAAERQVATNRRPFNVQVFGLLKAGRAPETAAAEVATVGERFKQEYPEVYPENTGFRATTSSVIEQLTVGARQLLFTLLGTTGLILLIACANVANLTLARMLRRDRELAMRTALGAARGRLIRQLLTESTVLAVAGGAVGVLFAWSTIDALTAFVGRFTARTHQIDLDPTVLGFTLLVAVGTGLVFGTMPALLARVNPATALRTGGKGTSDRGGRHRLQSALIVAQVAVSVVLLIGAGLLLVSFYRLQRVEAGFKADRVMSAEVFGNFTKYPDPADTTRLYTAILGRLEGSPGVVSAAVTNAVPLAGVNPGNQRFQIAGRTYDTPDERPTADIRTASSKYFDTLGIPIKRGRGFVELDHESAPRVVVINEAMVRQWEGRDPIGAEIAFNAVDGQPVWRTIVGVSADVKQFGLDRDAVAQIYVPLRQSLGLAGRVLVRTADDPSRAVALIQSAVRAVDPDIPIENFRTLDELRDRYLATPRLTALLLTMFAALALVVTLTGITGVIAQSVSQRTQEFGLRMALGATAQAVLRMVLRQGLALVVLGLAIGIAAAAAAARVWQSYLYSTTPTDPLAFTVVAAAFLVAGVIACLGPAWRATRVDPMIALRAE